MGRVQQPAPPHFHQRSAAGEYEAAYQAEGDGVSSRVKTKR